jgi:hypothetical protein
MGEESKSLMGYFIANSPRTQGDDKFEPANTFLLDDLKIGELR